MSQHILAEGLFVYPTPVGCYYAVSSAVENTARKFINQLLQLPNTPKLDIGTLAELMGAGTEEEAIALLHLCQEKGLISHF